MVRMANLSVVGLLLGQWRRRACTRKLIKSDLFPEFRSAFYPGKFNNKTNGITPRRWLLACNPRLSDLITSARSATTGSATSTSCARLEAFRRPTRSSRADFMGVKHANKVDLARLIKQQCDVSVNPAALFDVQIKRLHEYKRQHLNLLHIIELYHKPPAGSGARHGQPRVFLFARQGRARLLPGQEHHPCHQRRCGKNQRMTSRILGKLKVVYLPNYGVTLAERIVPAADLSEQISTAGKEASGTGNMKLSLNGALTIGTLDGANVEIMEEVGRENIFIFGMTVEEVEALVTPGVTIRWDVLLDADDRNSAQCHRLDQQRLSSPPTNAD